MKTQIKNIRIYGIKNCNTVRKALDYLEHHHISYEFHDYKKLGIEASKIKEWAKILPLEKLINKNGPTYRNLPESEKKKLNNISTAITVMQANTSVIKRPLVENTEGIIVGFIEEEYNLYFNI
jgi:arsenate reductase